MSALASASGGTRVWAGALIRAGRTKTRQILMKQTEGFSRVALIGADTSRFRAQSGAAPWKYRETPGNRQWPLCPEPGFPSRARTQAFGRVAAYESKTSLRYYSSITEASEPCAIALPSL